MQVGIQVQNFTLPDGAPSIAPMLNDIGRCAEEAGLDLLCVADHFFQMDASMGLGFAGPDTEMLECYTLLGYLAAVTERIRLGALVNGVTYREPGLLAKTVTTLDVLSGGRSFLGIGGAWHEHEHRALGFAFPPIAERLERVEQAVQICLQMWSPNNGPYNGKHYQLEETLCVPQPLQQPHPPILIAGGGERKTLRMVARYGSACNFTAPPDVIQQKLSVLRGHCEAVGRNYDEIQKTAVYMGNFPTPEAHVTFIDEMKSYADAGVDLIIMLPIGGNPVAQVQSLAPIVATLNEL